MKAEDKTQGGTAGRPTSCSHGCRRHDGGDVEGASLKEKTARGLFWGGMNNMVQQVIGLAFGIVLGRLLSPSDYGMMAIISIFSLVATALQDSGFKVALTNLDHPRDEDYNSVFWFNIAMGTGMYLCSSLPHLSSATTTTHRRWCRSAVTPS